MKIGAALTGVVVVVCIVLLATVDGSENSTSANSASKTTLSGHSDA